MPKFSYIVKDANGKTLADVTEAYDKSAVVKLLQEQGYYIVSVQLIKTGEGGGTQAKKAKQKKFSHTKIKLNDLIVFARQLTTMMDAGVTMLRSLDVILTQVESRKFEKVVAQIKDDVEQGSSLSESLEKHPKVFNQFWTSLVEVGEASGTMPTVLNKLTFYLEQQAGFKSTIVSAIIYPFILFLVAIGAILFFAFWVAPRFESIFATLDTELPMLTRMMLNFFEFLKKYIILIFLAAGAIGFLFKKYIQTFKGRLNWEKFLFSLPKIGAIYKLIVLERFSSMMAILIDSGVPILHALDIAQRLVDNNTCGLIINDIKEGVREGKSIVGPMEESGFFPPLSVQMITVGEETGELSKMLKHVSNFYLDAVETFMKRFGTIVEPVMLIFMGGIIGVIVLAMFMPMFEMSSLGG